MCNFYQYFDVPVGSVVQEVLMEAALCTPEGTTPACIMHNAYHWGMPSNMPAVIAVRDHKSLWPH